MDGDTLLVSSMGTGDQSKYEKTSYALDDKTHKTKFSPVALAELVETDRALIARTKEASQNDDALEGAFKEVGVPCEFETITVVENRKEIDARVGELIELIREDDPEQVVLDITFGFRSLPMVFFAAVLHLDALTDIKLGGIYYSEFRSDGEVTPFVDMTHLHTLMEWYHAINTFGRTRELRPVYALLDERREELYNGNRNPYEFASFVDELGELSRLFDSGLPLETEIAARDTLEDLDGVNETQFIGPSGKFQQPLNKHLTALSTSQTVDGKSDIELDIEELQRQRNYVKLYYEQARYRFTIGCARELFINRIIYDRENNESENWLKRDTRKTVKRELNDLRNAQIKTNKHNSYVNSQNEDNPEQDGQTDTQSLNAIDLWNRLGDIRNTYAHSGFKEKGITKFNGADNTDNDTRADEAIKTLCEKIDDDEYWSEII